MTDILIVEDSKADQIFIARALDALDIKISYKFANDGREALDELENGLLPKVVVTDLKMPRLNGRELVQAIKTNERTKFIPTIVFSTSDAQEDVHACYRNYANAYIVKPSSPKEYGKFAKTVCDFWLDQVVLPHDDHATATC